jgi:hypothetical protein
MAACMAERASSARARASALVIAATDQIMPLHDWWSIDPGLDKPSTG